MSHEIPELADKTARPSPRKARGTVIVAVLAIAGVTGWFQRDRLVSAGNAFFSPNEASTADLRAEIDRLAEERNQLANEVEEWRQESLGAESSIDASFATSAGLVEEIALLKDQLATLEDENLGLTRRLNEQERNASRKLDRLQEKIAQLESLARHERQEWDTEVSRLQAANDNLEKQNALLKDRLAGALMASVDPPAGTNAAEALDRGSLEIDALERRITELETQLSASGRQRNLLARSLQETREDQAATSLTATLSADAGDRVMADLSERFAVLQRQARESTNRQEKERRAWNEERSVLVAARDALRADVTALREELASLRIDSPSESPPAETALETEITPRPAEVSESVENPGPVLVEKPGALSAPARPLFEKLLSLDAPPNQLKEAYEGITEQTGGRLALTLPFPAGGASLEVEAREEIRALVAASPETRFLVIGYASIDGSESSNRELSSRRALATAEAIAESGPAHPVEAVYFGQTRRFDSRNRAANRVVEIWKID